MRAFEFWFTFFYTETELYIFERSLFKFVKVNPESVKGGESV